MTFKQWWIANQYFPCDTETAKQIWDAATELERQRCASIAKAQETEALQILDNTAYRLGRGVSASLILALIRDVDARSARGD